MKSLNENQNSRSESLSNNKWPSSFLFFTAGASVGALFAYYWDPARGNYRRALVRDQWIRFQNQVEKDSQRVFRDFSNRLRGFAVELKKWRPEDVDDEILVSRIRSAFGREIRHPKSVTVNAASGVITLSGHILSEEVSNLIECVRKVRGVRSVINNLMVHETSEGVPSLQGKGPRYLQ